MSFKKMMKEYKFKNMGEYFSRVEEEDIYEVIRVGNKYVVRRESSCRFDVRVSVDICSGLEELEIVLRDILDYYDCYFEEEE